MAETTCVNCLRTQHVRCSVVGCVCSCRHHRFLEPDGPRDSEILERQRAERKRIMRAGEPAKPTAVVPADFPPAAAERTGRYMTPLQTEWVPRLRDAGLTVQQIGAALGGFKHVAVVQVLNKTREAA